jgi:pyruvate formate lyase activating enzyme
MHCGRCSENPDTKCRIGARRSVAKTLTVAEVLKEILADESFYRKSGGGVTLSGGEVLMQVHFAIELLKQCKENYIHTAIETCGMAPWYKLEAIAAYCDQILFDIKLIDEEKHSHWTGASNKIILENLTKLSQIHHNIVVRIPLVPGVNDNHEELAAIAEFTSSLGLQNVHILPYHNLAKEKYRLLGKEFPLMELTPPSNENLTSYSQIFTNHNLNCRIGG